LLWNTSGSKANLRDWDSTNRIVFLKNIEIIIKDQLENPFLLQNSVLAKQWSEVFRNISNYYFVSNFEPSYRDPITLKKELDYTWVNCYISIQKLWTATNHYLTHEVYTDPSKSNFKDWYGNGPDPSFMK